MYQLLFLIHGMGSGARPAGSRPWWTELLNGLKRSARTYGHDVDLVTSAPRPGQVLVVPLTYHEQFDQIRTRWSQQTAGQQGFIPLLQALLAHDAAAGEASGRVPGWAANAGEFFWTHVLDVILYRYVNEFRTPIRESVATQIAAAWHRADIDNDASTPVHFVAHSLGTAVLHDSIALLAQDPAFSPNTHLISSVITCANVSAVLATNFPAYASADRPTGIGGMTAAHFSFRHELDPIAAVHPFRGDLNGWPAAGYRDMVPIDVKDWNVHGIAHYLENPLAHMRLFERLWDAEDWDSRRDPAITAYKASPGTPCPMAIAQVRADLRAILEGQWPAQNPVGLLEFASRTIPVLEKARTSCGIEPVIP